MSAESEIYSCLSTAAGVTAKCSTRIYPLQAPQDEPMPYIVYECVQADHQGYTAGQIGYSHRTYSVECTDDSFSGALALAASVATAMEGLTGTAIKACSLRQETMEWAPLSDGDDVGAYTVVQDWYIRTAD